MILIVTLLYSSTTKLAILPETLSIDVFDKIPVLSNNVFDKIPVLSNNVFDKIPVLSPTNVFDKIPVLSNNVLFSIMEQSNNKAVCEFSYGSLYRSVIINQFLNDPNSCNGGILTIRLIKLDNVLTLFNKPSIDISFFIFS